MDVAHLLSSQVFTDDRLSGRGLALPIDEDFRFSMSRPAGLPSTQRGLMRSEIFMEWGWRPKKRYDIWIEAGLPVVQFDMVAAHELTHVWVDHSCAVEPPLIVNEGLAELNAYWILEKLNRSRSAAVRRQLAESSDPVYGAGYRIAADAEQRAGWVTVANRVIQTGHLP